MRKSAALLMIILLFTLSTAINCYAMTDSNQSVTLKWSKQNTGVTVTLNNVLWDGKMYIAVGDAGTILTSADGKKWIKRKSGTANNLYGLTYSLKGYVAVGAKGTVLYSVNAVSWKMEDSSTKENLNHVLWNGEQVVAVGDAIIRSSDCIKWSNAVSRTEQTLSSAIWDGKNFIAVSDVNLVMMSKDGSQWENLTLNEGEAISDICFDGSKYVTVGSIASTEGMTPLSRMGDSIEALANYLTEDNYEINAAVKFENLILSNGQYYTIGGKSIFVSKDGFHWVEQKISAFKNFREIICGKDMLVVVGEGGTVYTSNKVITNGIMNYSLDTYKIVEIGDAVELPKEVNVMLSDDVIKKFPVLWDQSKIDTTKSSTYIVEGIITGFSQKTQFIIDVQEMIGNALQYFDYSWSELRERLGEPKDVIHANGGTDFVYDRFIYSVDEPSDKIVFVTVFHEMDEVFGLQSGMTASEAAATAGAPQWEEFDAESGDYIRCYMMDGYRVFLYFNNENNQEKVLYIRIGK